MTVQHGNRSFQVEREPCRVGSFEHVSGFVVSAGERDVNERATNLDGGCFCDEFINHAGTLSNRIHNATNAGRHDTPAQPEEAFI